MSEVVHVEESVRAFRGSAEFIPIIPGFHPDPTICRVGDDYYLATSSFEYFPGAPIFHSSDLVSWTQIGNILTSRDQFRKGTPGPSTGIYGSTLRHHDGRFWFITTNVSDFTAGQVIVTAENPAGPWSDPVFVSEAIGIDPDLSWDDDGQSYLTWHVLDFTIGGQEIRQAPIDLSSGRLLEPSYPVWQGSGLASTEGPHLYHVGSYWYILLAEGGTERGHAVTVARSQSIRGPFEPSPRNPIFSHRSNGHPVQSVGHADLVVGPDGRWAAVYLGTRPHGSTPGYHVLGRETFLAGIDWIQGWPVFDESRFDVPLERAGFFDDFSDPVLNPRWVVPDGEPENLVSRHHDGSVSFRSSGEPADLLCARVEDLAWTAEAVVETAGELRLRLDDRHWFALVAESDTVRVMAQIGDMRQELAAVPANASRMTLRLAASPPGSLPVPFGHAGPDDVSASFDSGEGFVELVRMDGRYFSTEVAAGFTGRMLALGSPNADGRLLSITYRPRALE